MVVCDSESGSVSESHQDWTRGMRVGTVADGKVQYLIPDPAKDAMGTSADKPIVPNAGFTADMAEARRSIARLGALAFDTLLVGHGEPITSGAAGLVAGLGRAG